MDNQQIIQCYKRGDKKRKLTREEIDELCSKIKCPFPLKKKNLQMINSKLEYLTRMFAKNREVYGCYVEVFIDNIYKAFLRAIDDPGASIGARTADSIGQQAMQTLLNTFHQAGASKPGGTQGIKENISLPDVREQTYTNFHFINENYTESEVLDLAPEFIGMSVEKLCISIKTLKINISEQVQNESVPSSKEDAIEMFKKGILWWYKYCKYQYVYGEEERVAIRFEIDLLKLYSLKKSLVDIANLISSCFYSISKKKTKVGKIKHRYVCFPSPTFMGIIDVFISSDTEPSKNDVNKDYFAQSSIKLKNFDKIHVSGIKGIENFYPVTKTVTSCISAIEKAYDTVEIDGKEKKIPIGTWIYLKDMRYSHIPINRVIKLLKKSGFKILETEKSVPLQNLEFNAHKIRGENRTSIDVEFYKFPKTENTRFYITENEEKINITSDLFTEEYSPQLISETKEFFKSSKDLTTSIETVKFKNIKNSNDFLESFTNKDHPNHLENVNQYFSKVKKHECIKVQTKVENEEGEKVKIYFYINCLKLQRFKTTVTPNLKAINSPKNYYSLNNILVSSYCIKDIRIPQKLRLPKLRATSKISDLKICEIKKGILIDSLLPFRESCSIPYTTNENELKDKVKQVKDKKPLEVLTDFLMKNCTKEENTYVYAETKGSNLRELCSHKLINPNKVISNVFLEVDELFGIEALRNLIVFDLGGIISTIGYIHKKYVQHIADIETCNGKNKFTSEGVKNQGSGPIAAMSFDNAKKYASRFSSVGSIYSLKTCSTEVFVEGKIPIGTGYGEIVEIESMMKKEIKNVENDISELRFEDDKSEEIAKFLRVMPSKFPIVKEIIDLCVVKTPSYFLNVSRNMFKKAKIQKLDFKFTNFMKNTMGVLKVTIDKTSLKDLKNNE